MTQIGPGLFTGGRLEGGTLNVDARPPSVSDDYNPSGVYGNEGRSDPLTTISVSSGYDSSALAQFEQAATFGNGPGEGDTGAKIDTSALAQSSIEACRPPDGGASALYDIFTTTLGGPLGLKGAMALASGTVFSASLSGADLQPSNNTSGNQAGWEFSAGGSTTNGTGQYFLGSIAINATVRNAPGSVTWTAGGPLAFSAADDGNVSAIVDDELNGVTTRSELFIEVTDGLVSSVTNTGVFVSLSVPAVGAPGTFTLAMPNLVATWDLLGIDPRPDPFVWTTEFTSDVGAHATRVVSLDCGTTTTTTTATSTTTTSTTLIPPPLPTTTTIAPPAPTTTTTLPPTPPEQCDNGTDDDGDGLGDATDPDCCATQGTLALSPAVVRRNAGGKAGSLKLRGTLTGGEPIDPTTAVVALQAAAAPGVFADCVLPPGTLTAQGKNTVGFKDPARTLCPPFKSLKLQPQSAGTSVTLYAPSVPLAEVRGKTMTLSLRVGDQCATGTAPIRRPPPPSHGCD